jgi:lysozyme family protein
MSNFEEAVIKVLKNEGGFNKIKEDRGGATNYGVSLKAYKELYPSATESDIFNLTEEDAKEFYRQNYWLKAKIDKVSHQGVATKFFDIVVNTGVKQGSKLLQRSIGVAEDGIVGQNTLKKLNQLCETDHEKVMDSLCATQEKFYLSIIEKRPEQVKFIKGWLVRAKKRY